MTAVALILQPEQHPRFGRSYTYSTEIRVGTDLEDGEPGHLVTLSIELDVYEDLNGPAEPWKLEESERLLHIATEVGENVVRNLTPSEARDLAAALWHQADIAERARRP